MSLILDNFVRQTKGQPARPLLFRDQLLTRILRSTSRSARNNMLLVGEPGVGKTALIKGLAARISQNKVVPKHIGSILQIDTSRLAVLLAEHDSQTLDLERTALLKEKQAMFLFDDASFLLEPTDAPHLRSFLRPLLERPDIFVCMVCGMGDYRRSIERDPFFSREFEVIQVPELSLQESQDICLAHGTSTKNVDSAVIRQSVALAERYISERSLPDKALSLLDETAAKVRLEGRATITLNDCKQLIAERTGIPVDTLSAGEQEKLLNLEHELDEQLIGQPHVTKAVAKVIRRARAGLKDPGRPTASFLFLGSSGVGKTELAKVLSKIVYHNERSLLRFDMSEFSEPHNVQRLVGAPPGYIGFEDGGQLTNAVLAQPYSLILLDEIEKAHAKVFDIFLQVMDDGRLTDGKGRTVDFSNCTIIATSNIALEEILTGFSAHEDITKRAWYEEKILPLLGDYFRPEFINRFDDVLVFSPFSKADMVKIASLEVKKLTERLHDLHVDLTVDETQLNAIVEAQYNPIFGARPLRRYLQETIENDLAEKLLRRTSGES